MATNPYLALLRHFAEDLDKQIKENVLLGTSVNMKLTASNEKFSQKTKNALKTLERKFEKSEALDELTDGGRVSLADAVERKPLDMTTAAGVSGRTFQSAGRPLDMSTKWEVPGSRDADGKVFSDKSDRGFDDRGRERGQDRDRDRDSDTSELRKIKFKEDGDVFLKSDESLCWKHLTEQGCSNEDCKFIHMDQKGMGWCPSKQPENLLGAGFVPYWIPSGTGARSGVSNWIKIYSTNGSSLAEVLCTGGIELQARLNSTTSRPATKVN